ncbi:helix-turn-helix transcriptional regulator [Aeromicrobium sp. 50.2.37]|uniref:ArsR/SmtB family transcription factor n=1 Tax=Aeromicrobium sp. 50.2.37 TaxID=2969305 RepID=UPI0021504DC2|nr:metalloregulator ArsR/SmtB family transcription factor [Aeromicrobium sp. 50.2.37]MCR4514046.1 metalloregulator ArsR/SmtB family transcription factor [Aeromicrobium sp. 50.2.37]
MDVYAALADPVRRALLARLAEGPRRVADLAAEHPVSRPAVSKHLRLLSEVGLVTADERGRERHYRLRAEPLGEVRQFVDSITPRPPVPEQALDALATEVARTRRERRDAATERPATRTHEESA